MADYKQLIERLRSESSNQTMYEAADAIERLVADLAAQDERINIYERRFLSKQERFEQFVTSDPVSGCWLWKGAVDNPPRLAYGKFWDKDIGRSIVAHRAAWLLYRGSIPSGLCVLHRCDVPMCVNPAHLFLGTHAENTHDMIVKGRRRGTQYGENNNFAKLTKQQVLFIRGVSGRSQRDLAKQFGVTQACVSRIRRRVNWYWLEG